MDAYVQVTFLIIDDVPPPDKAWMESNKGGRMADPAIWHREYYQRNVVATKIQEKHHGSRYVVLCSDADEIPNGAFVRELRHPAVYERTHKAHHLNMNFSYYNFNWESEIAW